MKLSPFQIQDNQTPPGERIPVGCCLGGKFEQTRLLPSSHSVVRKKEYHKINRRDPFCVFSYLREGRKRVRNFKMVMGWTTTKVLAASTARGGQHHTMTKTASNRNPVATTGAGLLLFWLGLLAVLVNGKFLEDFFVYTTAFQKVTQIFLPSKS